MLIFKKEKQSRKLVLEHIKKTQECLLVTRDLIGQYTAGDVDTALATARRVVELESEADVLKRSAREQLYAGAFLPQIRSDVYRLVEAVDSIAGKAEKVANFITNQLPQIPSEFNSATTLLLDTCLECYEELHKGLKSYLKPKGEYEKLQHQVSLVSELETRVDEKEAELSKQIFTSSMELAAKIHLRQLVRRIANIADSSEKAADELAFAAMKSIF